MEMQFGKHRSDNRLSYFGLVREVVLDALNDGIQPEVKPLPHCFGKLGFIGESNLTGFCYSGNTLTAKNLTVQIQQKSCDVLVRQFLGHGEPQAEHSPNGI